MRRTLCTACQYGDHANHVEVVQAVPKGVMGGARCSCKGDCKPPKNDPVLTALKWLRRS